MTEFLKDPALLTERSAFLERIVERLATHACDFQESYQAISPSVKKDHHRFAAGVLLPLLFQESAPGQKREFVFQLIKRSSLVPQSGDLSLPGGMLHPFVDRMLRPLLVHGPLPIIRGKAGAYALQQGKTSFRFVTLFLTNALREAWEEIRLSPARVDFLGPLPTYSLTLFRRTIFPLAGFVQNPGRLRPNREVEKIISIPISSFYRNDLFGRYQIDASAQDGKGFIQYPCLIHREADGGEEVLWGATFHIIIRFLGIVTDYHLPEWRQGPIISRKLHHDYLTGHDP